MKIGASFLWDGGCCISIGADGPLEGFTFLIYFTALWFWFFNGFPVGFRTTLNLFLLLEITKYSFLWYFLLDSSSIRRRVIRLSIENSFVLCRRNFLISFQPGGSLSMITSNWNCSSRGIPSVIVSWAILWSSWNCASTNISSTIRYFNWRLTIYFFVPTSLLS